MTTGGFFDKNAHDGTTTFAFSPTVISFLISLFASSFGMSKFFVNGPLPIIPKDKPLNGMASVHFVVLLFLNLMFCARIISIEWIFFTYYKRFYYGASEPPQSIDQIIPGQYRLLIYLLPPLLSFLANILRIACTSKGWIRLTLKYPQFVLSPCFTPFMFEGVKCENSDRTTFRIWKVGSLINSIFIGCVPQSILIISDYFRGVISFNFNIESTAGLYTNAIFHNSYGNIIFASISANLFLFLTIVAYYTQPSPIPPISQPDVSEKEHQEKEGLEDAPLKDNDKNDLHHGANNSTMRFRFGRCGRNIFYLCGGNQKEDSEKKDELIQLQVNNILIKTHFFLSNSCEIGGIICVLT